MSDRDCRFFFVHHAGAAIEINIPFSSSELYLLTASSDWLVISGCLPPLRRFSSDVDLLDTIKLYSVLFHESRTVTRPKTSSNLFKRLTLLKLSIYYTVLYTDQWYLSISNQSNNEFLPVIKFSMNIQFFFKFKHSYQSINSSKAIKSFQKTNQFLSINPLLSINQFLSLNPFFSNDQFLSSNLILPIKRFLWINHFFANNYIRYKTIKSYHSINQFLSINQFIYVYQFLSINQFL